MNTTILITPRAFGNIAAAAMSHGCDVTTFLVRAALDSSNKRSRLRAASSAMSALPLPRAEEVASPEVPARVSTEDAWDAADQPVRIESLASLREVEHA